MKKQPQALYAFLRGNLGKRCLAPLTDVDARALLAAYHIAELQAYCNPTTEIAQAFGLVVRQMQPSTRYLAYHAIAHAIDWSDRQPLWEAAGLGVVISRLCAFEPGGSYVDQSKL